MGVVKRSVAFDPDVWTALHDWADAEGVGVSAVVNDALRDALVREAGLAAMEQWQSEHGRFAPEELAWADRLIDRRRGPGCRWPDDRRAQDLRKLAVAAGRRFDVVAI
jgi:hypothetical protein